METADLPAYVLALGAVLRLTRLAVDDSITEPVRDKITSWHRCPAARFASKALACSWCTSMWVAAVVVPLAYYFPNHPGYTLPALVLTVAWLTGILNDWLDEAPPAREVELTFAAPVVFRREGDEV